MTDNVPAVREPAPVAKQDVDSWIPVVEQVSRLATMIADTEFVPRGLRGSAPATAAAMLYGREVGLPPMTALTQTHVIDGKPGIAAEAMRAMILAAGHEIEFLESTSARCVMRGRRRGQENWTVVEWTLDMARAAGLLNKTNWKGYAADMLLARCSTRLAKMVFPDVIHGFSSLEELTDLDGGEGSSSPVGGSSTVQRKKGSGAGTRGEPDPASRPERPALEGPPLPGEDGYTGPTGSSGEQDSVGKPVEEVPGDPVSDADDRVDPKTPDPEPVQTVEEGHDPSQVEPTPPPPGDVPERPATKPDLRMVHASFNKLLEDIDDEEARRQERLAIATAIAGRVVETFNDLTSREARLIADTVARHKTRADLYALLDATVDGAP